ncbi:MAG: outer membrane beta-barrel protein [Nitrospirota bacterium]|jgi:hypothetical protein
MKRVLMGIAAILLLLISGSGAARGEEGARVEMGIKMWLNNWRHNDPRLAENIKSDYAALLGPAIEAKFGDRLIAEASFLFSVTDYTFSNSNTINDGRQDVDIAIGYLIVPNFGVLAGYKDTSLREKETGITQTLAGPLVGVVAHVPVDQETSFYTRLNYLFIRHKESGVTEDSPGWNFEFGIRYAYTRDFAGTLGYKYETNTGRDSNVEDSFSGLTLGAMFAF